MQLEMAATGSCSA